MLSSSMYLYTLTLLNAQTRTCSLRSTDPRVHGVKTVCVLGEITNGRTVGLQFANGVLYSHTITAARIEGRGRFYNIFG